MRSSEDWTSSRAESSPERTSPASSPTGRNMRSAAAVASDMRRAYRAVAGGPPGSGARRGDVRLHPGEHRAQALEVLVVEALAQPGVVRHRGVAERQEGPLALRGELDALHAAVLGQPLAPDEPGALHPVEVVGEGRALDPDRLGELALGRGALRLEREEHEPDGPRSARLGEGVVEGAAHALGRRAEGEADGLLTRARS